VDGRRARRFARNPVLSLREGAVAPGSSEGVDESRPEIRIQQGYGSRSLQHNESFEVQAFVLRQVAQLQSLRLSLTSDEVADQDEGEQGCECGTFQATSSCMP